MLQRMRTEGHAGLLVDTREQVLDFFFRSRSGEGPSSHMGQHLCAAVAVRYPATANSLVHFPQLWPNPIDDEPHCCGLMGGVTIACIMPRIIHSSDTRCAECVCVCVYEAMSETDISKRAYQDESAT